MGQNIPKKNICRNCGAALPPGSRFCRICGRQIIEEEMNDGETIPLTTPVNPAYLTGGSILHGKYRINGVIGQGGFGITYDGTDMKLDMHVAIKEYFPRPIASRQVTVSRDVTCSSNTVSLYEQGMQNFLKEARNMAKFVGEENFVAVHDYFAENNTAYIIMEFVNGQNLKQYLLQYGRLSMNAVMAIMDPVMNALEKIHARKMIHRDISPSNIMILADGRVKLLDFGAVRDVTLETQTLTTMSAVYKHGYSPIEQQTRDMKQGTYSDIYALCATMYEMLTGTVPPSPFTRLSGSEALIPPSGLGVQISPAQEEALLKGLAIYGNDRIQTVGELREALYSRSTPGIKKQGKEYGIDNKRLFIALGGVSALLVCVLGFLLFQIMDSDRHEKTAGSTGSAAAVQSEKEISAQTDDESSRSDNGPESTDQDHGVQENVQEINQPEENQPEENQPEENQPESAMTEQSVTEKEVSEDNSYEENQSGEQVSQENAFEENRPGEQVSQENTDEEAESVAESAAEETAEETPVFEFPEGTMAYGGHHYYIYNDVETSWEDALERCLERGGYLAVINDSSENEALYQYMLDRGYEEAFFGLNCKNGNWEYITGDTSAFRDWGVNSKGEPEPNHTNRSEDYAELDIHMSSGHWNDAQFGKTTYTPKGQKYKDLRTYICEWEE